jgi:outer membrane lipoprotein-sorting protein
MKHFFFFLALVFLSFTASYAQSKPDSVLDSIRERLKEQQTVLPYETAEMTMIITNSKGQKRERSMKSWQFTKDSLVKAVLIFSKPAQVKGTGLLTIRNGGEQTQKLYLPAVKRVQTIGSSQKSDSFMSSDFSFEDLGQFDADENRWVLQAEQADFYLITAFAKNSESSYDSLQIQISKKMNQPEKIRYFSKAKAVKELSFLDYSEPQSGIFRASRLLMQNLVSGGNTEITWLNRSFDEIPDSYFTERLLLRGN